MNQIPIFKNITLEQLCQIFNFPDHSEWVQIGIRAEDARTLDPDYSECPEDDIQPGDRIDYETNRYDGVFKDPASGRTLRVYIYMNDACNQLISLDRHAALQGDETVRYPTETTGIQEKIKNLIEKDVHPHA